MSRALGPLPVLRHKAKATQAPGQRPKERTGQGWAGRENSHLLEVEHLGKWGVEWKVRDDSEDPQVCSPHFCNSVLGQGPLLESLILFGDD